ncbi:unnamed protein product, partial [Iphiclides podalirius]
MRQADLVRNLPRRSRLIRGGGSELEIRNSNVERVDARGWPQRATAHQHRLPRCAGALHLNVELAPNRPKTKATARRSGAGRSTPSKHDRVGPTYSSTGHNAANGQWTAKQNCPVAYR